MNAVLPLNTAPRRRWPLVSLALLALVVGVLFAAWSLVSAVHPMPVSVFVDGQPMVQGLDLASMPPAHKVVGVLVIGLLMLAALVVVPMALVLVAVCVVLVLLAMALPVLAVIGLPLLAVAAVVALLLAPLALVGWIVWKLVAA